jgi:hypothetical protein
VPAVNIATPTRPTYSPFAASTLSPNTRTPPSRFLLVVLRGVRQICQRERTSGDLRMEEGFRGWCVCRKLAQPRLPPIHVEQTAHVNAVLQESVHRSPSLAGCAIWRSTTAIDRRDAQLGMPYLLGTALPSFSGSMTCRRGRRMEPDSDYRKFQAAWRHDPRGSSWVADRRAPNTCSSFPRANRFNIP